MVVGKNAEKIVLEFIPNEQADLVNALVNKDAKEIKSSSEKMIKSLQKLKKMV